MDDRNLVRKPLNDTSEDGSAKWTWAAAALGLAFVLLILLTVSTGEDTTQTASYSPPAIDRMVTPPITQPSR
jgi:hypothetical protein